MRKVRLEDDTCGTVDDDTVEIGDRSMVALHDENGNEIFVDGVVVEIFD